MYANQFKNATICFSVETISYRNIGVEESLLWLDKCIVLHDLNIKL